MIVLKRISEEIDVSSPQETSYALILEDAQTRKALRIEVIGSGVQDLIAFLFNKRDNETTEPTEERAEEPSPESSFEDAEEPDGFALGPSEWTPSSEEDVPSL